MLVINTLILGGLVERRETSGQHDVLIYNNLLEQLKDLTYDQEKHLSQHTEEMSQIENTKNKTDKKIAVLEDQFDEVQTKILQESFFTNCPAESIFTPTFVIDKEVLSRGN